MAKADVVDRNLTIARELRSAAEETRRALQISRDLVEHSRRQTRALTQPQYEHATDADCEAPSNSLVEYLIRAYELAEDEGEPRTRALLSQVLMHVGRRIALGSGLNAEKVVVH
jgi:hypothetical protein